MNAKQLVTLKINGRSREVRAAPTTTLLTVLRDELMLTGSKRGCNQGVCGACTVLIDDRPVRSCLSLAMNLTDRAITTVENLAQRQEFAPLQRSMLEHGAVQCGFLYFRSTGFRVLALAAQPASQCRRSKSRAFRQSLSLLRLR